MDEDAVAAGMADAVPVPLAHPCHASYHGKVSAGLVPATAERPSAKGLTAAICHDFDFPVLLRQAGTLGAAAALAPSDDWPDIAWLHANMARLRAVENGVTLLRPAYGVSLVADPEGRVLAAGNTFDGAWTVVATVPWRREWTLYATLHDTFSWLCAAGLLVLVPLGRGRAARLRT
ncbi:MAG: hypothetical protein OEY20_07080 [Gemmatimonadota bacterium]|nr:hypothetical protein [Gemmatimonadota bacterium]